MYLLAWILITASAKIATTQDRGNSNSTGTTEAFDLGEDEFAPEGYFRSLCANTSTQLLKKVSSVEIQLCNAKNQRHRNGEIKIPLDFQYLYPPGQEYKEDYLNEYLEEAFVFSSSKILRYSTNTGSTHEFKCELGAQEVEFFATKWEGEEGTVPVFVDYADKDDSDAPHGPMDWIPGAGHGQHKNIGRMHIPIQFFANGYIIGIDPGLTKFKNFTFVLPPSSYCLDGVSSTQVFGKLCLPKDYGGMKGNDLNRTDTLVVKEATRPVIRRCIKPFRLSRVLIDVIQPIINGSIKLDVADDCDMDPWDLYRNSVNPEPTTNFSDALPVFLHSSLLTVCSELAGAVSDPEVLNVKDGLQYADVRISPNGEIQVKTHPQGNWQPIETLVGKQESFCLDTFTTPDDEFSPPLPEHRKLILFCHDPTRDSLTSTQQGFFMSQQILIVIADLVLGIMLLVYVLIWNKQNVHGRTTAALTFSMFTYFVTLTFALYETYPVGTSACVTNAIVFHLSNLSMYFWIAVMNFDVWTTITSMVAVSQRRKGNTRFALYCLAAFGVPMAIVATSAGVHFTNDLKEIDREDSTLPQYGYPYCTLRIKNYIYYTLGPVLIAFVLSLTFGSLTHLALAKFKRETAKIKSANSANTKSAQNQFMLMLKLFVIMGTTWGLEIIVMVVYGENTLQWFGTLVSSYHCLITVFLFWMFLVKREVVEQLAGTVTCLEAVVSWVDDKRGLTSKSKLYTVSQNRVRTKASEVSASSTIPSSAYNE